MSAILVTHPDDVCMCGDYRKQHKDGIGRCLLEDGCTPGRCQRFRLYRRHGEARQAIREEQMVIIETGADGKPTVWCDPEIADLVMALNAGCVPTVASCSGHGRRPGNIALKDGRELIIARSFEEARRIDRLFPEEKIR